MTYTVVIKTIDTHEPVKRISCGTDYARALKVQRGVGINLNTAKYFTVIVEEAETK